MTITGQQKRRWSSRIGTIIRRTAKSHRLSDSISFDEDAEFIPRNWNESGKRFPHVALDIRPTRLRVSGTLCTIAESPLREAESTQSVTFLSSGGPDDELYTPSECSTSQTVTESPSEQASGCSPISRTGEISIISFSTNKEPYNEPPTKDLSLAPQSHLTEGHILTTEDKDEPEAPRSESTNEASITSYEMTHSNSSHHVPSNSSPSTTSRSQLPLVDPGNGHNSDDNVISWFSYSASSDMPEKLHTIGWLEYHFPNGNFYYFHSQRKISTEMDLTNDAFLDVVEDFWQEQVTLGLLGNSKFGGASNGFIEDEIWLKDIGFKSDQESKMMFEMWLIDHVARTMVLVSQEINNSGATTTQEDQIDMEHRYWAFIQSHPAHTVLPPNATSAAINTLAWAWTDHLLSLRDSNSIPFTREECRDLMTLIHWQSLGIVEKNYHQVMQTCIVSRVFLQVAQWHKSHQYDEVSPTDSNTSISISIQNPESSVHFPDQAKLEKSRIVRKLLDIVIFLSIFLFTLFFAVGQGGLMFTQIQVFVDKIIGLLGQGNALLPTLNWTTLRCMERLKDDSTAI